MVRSAPGVFEFGPFRFDVGERMLYRGSDLVPLTRKAAETLYQLLVNHGSLVAKPDLIRLVWPDTFVEESTLSQNIFTLRKVLGDDGQTFIETVPRRGYRFIAPVAEAAREQPRVFLVRPKRTFAFVTAGVLMTVIAAAGWRWSSRSTPVTKNAPSIAVLPFHPIGDDQDRYLGVAMADALISRLSNIRGVLVRPTSAVRKFTAPADPLAAGRELDVESVVDGSIQRAADRMRVTVQVIDVSRDAPRWSGTFEVPIADVFSLQDRISEKVADALMVNLRGRRSRYTENADAHRDYLEGRYFWNKRTAEGYVRAIECFQAAINKDPSYALAYAGLADAYALLGSMTNRYMPRHVAMPKALQAAQRALAIDDTLAEAHASLGFIRMHYQWDWEGGESEFRRAIALNAGYATAHHWYAYELIGLRRFDEAIHEIREAQKADPVSIIINTDVAEMLLFAGRYDEAVAQCRRTLDLDPNFALAYQVLNRAYRQKHDYENAVAAARKALELDPSRNQLLIEIASDYKKGGRLADAREAIDQWSRRRSGEYDTYFDDVTAALVNGNRDAALAILERHYAEHSGSLLLLNVDPDYDDLRADPRFKALLHRLRLDRKS